MLRKMPVVCPDLSIPNTWPLPRGLHLCEWRVACLSFCPAWHKTWFQNDIFVFYRVYFCTRANPFFCVILGLGNLMYTLRIHLEKKKFLWFSSGLLLMDCRLFFVFIKPFVIAMPDMTEFSLSYCICTKYECHMMDLSWSKWYNLTSTFQLTVMLYKCKFPYL